MLNQIYFEIWFENSLEIGWQISLEFLFWRKEKLFSFSFPSSFWPTRACGPAPAWLPFEPMRTRPLGPRPSRAAAQQQLCQLA